MTPAPLVSCFDAGSMQRHTKELSQWFRRATVGITAADLMDDRVAPFLHEHQIAVAP
jgi:hypothetical protein